MTRLECVPFAVPQSKGIPWIASLLDAMSCNKVSVFWGTGLWLLVPMGRLPFQSSRSMSRLMYTGL